MATAKISLEQFRTTKQQQLIKMLNDRSVQKNANTILKDYINEFVPKDSGSLRRSAIVTHQSISWGRGLPYARYQYEGEIYGKNYPIIKGGRIVGWFSKPGIPKFPTGRMIGDYSGEWFGWLFGYSTPGTEHHWDQLFKNSSQWKSQANREITRYLKRECKNRGLKT